MKRKIIALLLAITLFVAPQVNVTNSSAKTEKYQVYNSSQAKVSGNKLVVRGPYTKKGKEYNKKIIFRLTNKTKYWDPNYYGSDPMKGKMLDKKEFKKLLKAGLFLEVKVNKGKVVRCELSS